MGAPRGEVANIASENNNMCSTGWFRHMKKKAKVFGTRINASVNLRNRNVTNNIFEKENVALYSPKTNSGNKRQK